MQHGPGFGPRPSRPLSAQPSPRTASPSLGCHCSCPLSRLTGHAVLPLASGICSDTKAAWSWKTSHLPPSQPIRQGLGPLEDVTRLLASPPQSQSGKAWARMTAPTSRHSIETHPQQPPASLGAPVNDLEQCLTDATAAPGSAGH